MERSRQRDFGSMYRLAEHGPDGPYWVGWEDARCVGEDEHGAHHHHSHQGGASSEP